MHSYIKDGLLAQGCTPVKERPEAGGGLVLGLTGGIASGKSAVAALFAAEGAVWISADQVARDVVAPGTALRQQLFAIFGSGIKTRDGDLDRQALGQVVFADKAARQRLNALLHPAIARLSEERLQAWRGQGKVVVYEAPLLFEAGAQQRVDKVVAVKVAEEHQLRRLCQRDKLTVEQARERMASQMSPAEKVARADYVVDNSADLAVTRQQVRALYRFVQQFVMP